MRFLGILDLLNSPIIVILVIVLGAALVISLTSLKPNPKYILKDIEKLLKDNQIDYQINSPENKDYTFKLTVENQEYTVLVLPIEKFAEVTINNFNTWEMHYGAGDRPGKAQPFKTKIAEIPTFMNLEADNKLVLIQPDAKQIVYWKNENEIVFVEPNTKVYGINVLNVTDLPKFFNKK